MIYLEDTMPPKVKISKENIIAAAINLIRSEGTEAVNARTLAASLNCSTQPIFSNFATMEELQKEVLIAALPICNFIKHSMCRSLYRYGYCTYKNW